MEVEDDKDGAGDSNVVSNGDDETSQETESTLNAADECEKMSVVVPAVPVNSNVSKRQLRKQEKLRKWQATEAQRKEKRREKKKEMKERRKKYLDSLKLQAIQEGKEPASITDPNSRKRLKSNSMKKSTCKVGICIDLSFSDLMIDKDLHKCIKQLLRCYSINRRFENPVQFYVTNFAGKSAEVMQKHVGHHQWDVNFRKESYLDLPEYPKDKIVYLTAESENILQEPMDDTLYVIGGLVDHNSKKGLCHTLAKEKGVHHARLPLDEFVEMSARKVLSIDHVFEILGGVTQKRSWQEVLLEVLPPRTQPRLKRKHSDVGDDVSDNEGSQSDNSRGCEIKVDDKVDTTIQVEADVTNTESTLQA